MVVPIQVSLILEARIRQETNLCESIASHYNCQTREIKYGKDGLGCQNVRSFIGDGVQDAIDVDMEPRVDKRTSIASDIVIILLAFDIKCNLLHICFPIDFGVFFR